MALFIWFLICIHICLFLHIGCNNTMSNVSKTKSLSNYNLISYFSIPSFPSQTLFHLWTHTQKDSFYIQSIFFKYLNLFIDNFSVFLSAVDRVFYILFFCANKTLFIKQSVGRFGLQPAVVFEPLFLPHITYYFLKDLLMIRREATVFTSLNVFLTKLYYWQKFFSSSS